MKKKNYQQIEFISVLQLFDESDDFNLIFVISISAIYGIGFLAVSVPCYICRLRGQRKEWKKLKQKDDQLSDTKQK